MPARVEDLNWKKAVEDAVAETEGVESYNTERWSEILYKNSSILDIVTLN